MSSTPFRTRKKSSVSSCLCQINSPSTFATMTSQVLNWATTRGDQCSENPASFSDKSMLSLMGGRPPMPLNLWVHALASFCRETPAFLLGRVSYPIKPGQTDGGSRHSPGYFDAIFDAISRSAGQDHAVLR